MNLKKCPNNHYYNVDKFPYCPHCINEVNETTNTPVNNDTYSVNSSDNTNTDHSSNKVPTENVSPVSAATIPFLERLTAGWLVCISGSNRGLSFPIYYGNNHIGRNQNMNIRLKDETTISRENHAIINYNNTTKEFSLIPGNTVNPTFINDIQIHAPHVISDHDLIQLGECQLLFVSFCDDRFNW